MTSAPKCHGQAPLPEDLTSPLTGGPGRQKRTGARLDHLVTRATSRHA